MYIYQEDLGREKRGAKPKINLLNEKTIAEIRDLYTNEGYSVRGLMDKYDVSRATMYRVLKSIGLVGSKDTDSDEA